jgi:hypothetical protein
MVKKMDAPFPHRKSLREENGGIDHLARLLASWTDSRPHSHIVSQLTGGGGCHSVLSKTFHDEGFSCSVVVTWSTHREWSLTAAAVD